MSGFVLGRDGGDTDAWRGAEVQITASAEDTLGQVGPSRLAAQVVAGGEKLDR